MPILNTVDLKKDYNAGPGIKIGTYNDYSAMQGPCPEGFHVPTGTELTNIVNRGITIGAYDNSSQGATNFQNYFKAPPSGYIQYYTQYKTPSNVGTAFYRRSCTHQGVNTGKAKGLLVSTSSATSRFVYITQEAACAASHTLRPFKDIPAIPDNSSSWNTVYDGSSTATGAGIFYNSTEGLISISADGINWITISDKNAGATQVWNAGDEVNADNAGLFYQRGNNYGVTLSGIPSADIVSEKINASSYLPSTYYSTSVYKGGTEEWQESGKVNMDLRGGVTGVVTIDNAISIDKDYILSLFNQ